MIFFWFPVGEIKLNILAAAGVCGAADLQVSVMCIIPGQLQTRESVFSAGQESARVMVTQKDLVSHSVLDLAQVRSNNTARPLDGYACLGMKTSLAVLW